VASASFIAWLHFIRKVLLWLIQWIYHIVVPSGHLVYRKHIYRKLLSMARHNSQLYTVTCSIHGAHSGLLQNWKYACQHHQGDLKLQPLPNEGVQLLIPALVTSTCAFRYFAVPFFVAPKKIQETSSATMKRHFIPKNLVHLTPFSK